MKSKDFLLELYKRNQSVFTAGEIALIFPQIPYRNLRRKLSYYVKAGKILRPRRGIYAKEAFDPLELANKVYTPSYISFETVLREEGIIFQETAAIFAASYLTRKIKCAGLQVFYRKIKDEVLTNPGGIDRREIYSIASKERAFLDSIFVYKDYHFDNLAALDWEEVFALVKIYKSKVLEKRVREYWKIYQEENV